MRFDIKMITDELLEGKKIYRRTAVRGILRVPGAEHNQIIMVETNRGDYKFPGGGIEPGESEREALLREIAEETGYIDIEIGELAGTTFEQNLDTKETDAMFQMISIYYECTLKSRKRAPGVLDDYEEKLGFRPSQILVEDAYLKNFELMKKGMATPGDIPWLEREVRVLEQLTRMHQITAAMRACGKIMLEADRTQPYIDEKEGHANFVTVYDKKVQDKLQSRLHSILPEAIFIGEEGEEKQALGDGYAFIVDPIDGTTNFIKDYKCSVISVGLVKAGERILGAVYNPYLDELFTAEKGKGAFCNGTPIQVSNQPLEKGIVLFGTAPYYEELHKKSFELAFDYFKQAMDVRRSGSAAWDLCSIAAGRAELYFELKLSPWDYAAGSLIVEEAGGVVTTVEGGKIAVDAPSSILAKNGCI